MQKNILIPTDFSVESLNTLKLAVEQNTDHNITAILLYAEYAEFSILDQLYNSPAKIIAKRKSKAFLEAVDILKNRYEHNLTDVRTVLFQGENQNAFNYFTGALFIDEIYRPAFYKLKLKGMAFDPSIFFAKSKIKCISVEWESLPNSSDSDQLSALFKQ